MKKKVLFDLTSLLLAFMLVGCTPASSGGEGGGGDPVDPPAEEGMKMLDATLEKRVIELDEKTNINCSVEGVTYRSSDENIVEVSSTGRIEGVGMGMAYVTVSKEGYYDRVLKVFVDVYDTVDYLVEGFEFGPAIVGVKLNLEDMVEQSDLRGVNWVVKTNNSNRTILSVDLCDEEGQIINATESHYIRFSLQTNYSGWGVTGGADCFTYANNVNNWKQNIRAEVSLASGSRLEIGNRVITDAQKFNTIRSRISLSTRDWGEAKSYSSHGETLTYKAYEVDALREDGVKNPLVIWLHGMGEGGTDPDIALLGNDVTALGEEEIQSHFKVGKQKGAYVLAVQTPTMWMNNGTGGQSGGGNSIYRATLKDTIDYYIANNPDVETSRVYIGGCSNGGYMTMEMAINYGNFFRAFYPCCEAYADRLISNEQINALKDLPIWFIHAANDTTVNPASYTVATYQRLMAAGAKDVHFSYFVDVRGTDCNPSGNNYMGHYSWIYIFRDEVEYDQEDYENVVAPSTEEVKADGKAVNLFEWFESMK